MKITTSGKSGGKRIKASDMRSDNAVPAYQGLSLAKSRKAGRKLILVLIVGLVLA